MKAKNCLKNTICQKVTNLPPFYHISRKAPKHVYKIIPYFSREILCELCLHEKTIRSNIDLLFSSFPMGITENKKFVKKKTEKMDIYGKKWIWFEKTFYRKIKNIKNTFPTAFTEKY